MKRILFYCCFLVLTICAGAHASENCRSCFETRLHAYPSDRDTSVDAARNLLLDYLRDNKVDSLAILVNYCDSLFSPDSSWLSRRERYLIHYLTIDTSSLYDLEFYCTYYPLYDPVKIRKAPTNCLRQEHFNGTSVTMGSDNLSGVLRILARRATRDNHKKYPRYEDVWAFYGLLDSLCPPLGGSSQQILLQFKNRFPRSPFSRLRFQDRQYYEILHGKKASLDFRVHALIGKTYTLLPYPTRARVPNYSSWLFSIEGSVNQWILRGYASNSQSHTTGPITYDNGVLPSGWPVNYTVFGLDLGMKMQVTNKNSITPNIGFFRFNFFADTVIVGSQYVSFGFPIIRGCKLGLDFDHLIGVISRDALGPDIRVSTGILIADFPKINMGPKSFSFFLGLSIGIVNVPVFE